MSDRKEAIEAAKREMEWQRLDRIDRFNGGEPSLREYDQYVMAQYIAQYILSPPAHGPGLNAVEFLDRHYEAIVDWERAQGKCPSYEEMTAPFVAELRAALAPGSAKEEVADVSRS